MGKIITLMYRSYEIVGKIEKIKKRLEITRKDIPLSYTIDEESNKLVVICRVSDLFLIGKKKAFLQKK